MDALFLSCIELVALQGNEGCALEKLWKLLDTCSVSSCSLPLTVDVKQALWSSLVEADQDIFFTLHRSETAEQTKKKSLKAVVEVLERGVEPLTSLRIAEEAGVFVVASQELQDNAIGLYDAKLTRFQLSDIQRRTLGLLGAAGSKGMLQNDLANSLSQDNRNFFYVIKNLEQRGLLCKKTAFVRTDKPTSYFAGGKVQTNLIHLSRFAPDLDQEVMLTDGTCHSHHAMSPMSLGEEELGLMDDRIHFRRVCEQLRGQAGNCAAETELKRVLGFQGKKGHRMWRRIKHGMQRKGFIEEFVAAQNEKPIKVIRMLIDSLGAEASESEAGGEKQYADADEGEAEGLAGSQVAELSLDRQLFRLVIGAGSDGVNVSEIESYLALNTKRGSSRLKELEKRFDIKSVMVTQVFGYIVQGKASMSRYTAGQEILQRYQRTIEPLYPANGWLGAVEEAIIAGLETDDPFPTLTPIMTSTTAAVECQEITPQAVRACAHVRGSITDFPASKQFAQGSSEQFDAASAQEKQRTIAQISQSGDGNQGQEHVSHDVEKSAGATFVQISEDLMPRPGSNRGVPMLQACRVQWLIERVQEQDFLLSAEMPRFFRECEQREGNPSASLPDRKTCNRVVDKAQAEGKVQVINIAFPTRFGGLHARTHTVAIRPGLQQGPGLVDKVFSRYKSFHNRIRSDASGLAKMQAMEGVALPQVQLQPLKQSFDLNPAEVGDPSKQQGKKTGEQDGRSNDAFQAMIKHGFQPSKAMRCKLLHGLLLKMAALSQCQGDDLQMPQVDKSDNVLSLLGQPQGGVHNHIPSVDEAATSDFVITAVPGEGSAQSRLDVQAMPANDPRRKYTVTRVEMWEGLTVQQWLEIIGCTHHDADMVQQLAHSEKRIGDLNAQEQLVLFDGDITRPLSRLTSLLDILGRMGLLGSVIPLGSSAQLGVSGVDASAYVVQQQAVFQEPSGQHVIGESGIAAQRQRLTHVYEIFSVEGFSLYWSRLEYIVTAHADPGLFKSRLSASNPLKCCFPIDRVPELGHVKSWASANVVPSQDWAKIQAMLGGQDPNKVSADVAWDASVRLGISYSSILSYIRERRHKTRLGRLGGQDTGLECLDGSLVRKNTGNVAGKRRKVGLMASRMPLTTGVDLDISSNHRNAEKSQSTYGYSSRHMHEGEDVESDMESSEIVQVDRSALMTHKAITAKRKARWHKHEDRQLLVAWAGWLARNGMDRMLLWRQVKGRPALRTATCRHRLRQLLKHDGAGPLLMKLREIADGVYARQVLQTADAGDKADGRVYQQRSPQRLSNVDNRDGKRLVQETDLPTFASDTAQSKRVKGQAANQSETPAQENDLQSLVLLKQVFPIVDNTDWDAAQRVANLIEKVVMVAPKRHKEQHEITSQIGRRPGPRQGFKQLRSEVANLAGKDTKSRELLRQWAAGDLVTSDSCPNLAIYTAGEMIKSLLHIGNVKGTLGPGSEMALIGRFSEEEIKGAFALLHNQGIINKILGKQRALQLSDQFKNGIQVVGFPSNVFDEAEHFLEHLRRNLEIQFYKDGSCELSMDGGAAAVCLEQMAVGGAKLTLSGGLAVPNTVSYADNVINSLVDHTCPLDVSLPFDLSFCQQLPLEGFSINELKQWVLELFKKEVFFQPSLVALSHKIRDDAMCAAKTAFSESAVGIHDADLLSAMLSKVRKHGSAGLTFSELEGTLGECLSLLGEEEKASALQVAVNILAKHGLIRCFSCWDQTPVFIAAEHSQCYMAYPNESHGDNVEPIHFIEALQAENHLPPSGEKQPSIDLPIRPWFDHLGKINDTLFHSLARRTLALLIRHPGIPPRIACSQLGVIAPPNAMELLSLVSVEQSNPSSQNRMECGYEDGTHVPVFEACFRSKVSSNCILKSRLDLNSYATCHGLSSHM